MHKPLSLSTLPEKPLVSILVANYNYAQFIDEALASAQEQTYEHLEIIVCDDGSVDDSRDRVKKRMAADSRIQLVAQENQGVAVALNNAFAACKGDIICLLDADDYFDKTKIEQMLEALRANPNAGYVQHAMEMVDGAGKRLRSLPALGAYEAGWLADKLVARGGRWRSMPASALSFRREIADLVFPIPDMRSMADAYLYMLAPLLTEVIHLPAELAAYRLHGGNLTGTLQFDKKVSETYTSGMRHVNATLVSAIKERQLNVPELDINEHLTCVEHFYMMSLFDGEKGLWGKYGKLARKIAADDVYSVKRKVLGLAVLGSALLIPKSYRPNWITKGMNVGRVLG